MPPGPVTWSRCSPDRVVLVRRDPPSLIHQLDEPALVVVVEREPVAVGVDQLGQPAAVVGERNPVAVAVLDVQQLAGGGVESAERPVGSWSRNWSPCRLSSPGSPGRPVEAAIGLRSETGACRPGSG